MAKTRNDRKEKRRRGAEARQVERNKRTDEQQMDIVATRRGLSMKETARLLKNIK